MNYQKTALQILKDKVSRENIDLVLEEWNNFIEQGDKKDRSNLNDLVKEINDKLYKIKASK